VEAWKKKLQKLRPGSGFQIRLLKLKLSTAKETAAGVENFVKTNLKIRKQNKNKRISNKKQ